MKPNSNAAYRSGFLASLLWGPRLCAASPQPIFSSDPETIDTCIDWWNNADDSSSCEEVRKIEPWRFPLSYCVSTSDRDPPPGVTTTTVAPSTTTTSEVSTHVPSPTSWAARGCYPDDDPEYPVLELMVSKDGGDSSLDIESCEDSRWKASVNGTVLFAGVKDGNQCWCSPFVGGESSSDQTKCDKPCSGNKEQICGGEDYINVFEPVTTSQSETTTDTTTQGASSSAVPTTEDSGARRRAALL
ncbi:uncharacterized protein J7T54_006673 [Emericellopsis cladophorae]|uniref:WSC domain-containing protein n=1 Tax=Emericellopsis cladophorae TaxID=2686198 RepID=A0A9P9Y7R3_9HYPO|nr:uncharacterized protein J7T54_006673 [Emericellopsis cladophorae]KAI6784628.1 hypothetical protein J7T54_006673 [Emericellopsis cladophorae]